MYVLTIDIVPFRERIAGTEAHRFVLYDEDKFTMFNLPMWLQCTEWKESSTVTVRWDRKTGLFIV